MSAVGIERGYLAEGWSLNVEADRWNDPPKDFRAWITEEGSGGDICGSRAADRESAAMLALVCYVRVLRERSM